MLVQVVVHYPIFEDFSEGRKKFKLQGKLYVPDQTTLLHPRTNVLLY